MQLTWDIVWVIWAYFAGKILRIGRYQPDLSTIKNWPTHNKFIVSGPQDIQRRDRWLAWLWGAGFAWQPPFANWDGRV